MSKKYIDKAKALIINYGLLHVGVKVTARFKDQHNMDWQLLGQCANKAQVISLFDTTLPEFIRENMRAGAPLYLHVTFLNTSIETHGQYFGDMRREHQLYTKTGEHTAGVNWTSEWDTGWVKLVVWQSQLAVETHRPDSPQISQGCLRFIDDKCSMCLKLFTESGESEYDDTDSEPDTVVCLPCFHLFHESCIIKWRKSGRSVAVHCPICQYSTPPYTKWHKGRRIWHWSHTTPPATIL